jgi:hypothetical protein
MLLPPSPGKMMKTIIAILILATAMAFSFSAHGQGFLNLDFESASQTGTNFPANPGSGELVAVTNALPGWTAYNGDVALSEIYYVSNYSRVSGTVMLEGGSLALSGNFSVGLLPNGGISQTGMVPSDAESLDFEADTDVNLEVLLGDENLSYSAISTGPNYTIYGANIPAGMDGQTEDLVFEIQFSSELLLDNIQFLPTSVPEPAEWAVLGVGMLAFGLWGGKRIYLDRIHRIV